MIRSTCVAGLAAGLSLVALAAPAGAAPVQPEAQAAAARAGLPAARLAAAGSDVPAAIRVSSGVRTAYDGRYAKFLTTFRCERGSHYEIFGAVEQVDGRDEPTALATSEDEGPTGTCTGRSQRRMVYVVVGPVDPSDERSPVRRLRSGRAQAVAVLATAASRSAEPHLDAAALATVRVAPR